MTLCGFTLIVKCRLTLELNVLLSCSLIKVFTLYFILCQVHATTSNSKAA